MPIRAGILLTAMTRAGSTTARLMILVQIQSLTLAIQGAVGVRVAVEAPLSRRLSFATTCTAKLTRPVGPSRPR